MEIFKQLIYSIDIKQYNTLSTFYSGGSCGGGRGLVAGPDVGAHLGGAQILLHQTVDDVREVGLHQSVAQQLQLRGDSAQGATELQYNNQRVIFSFFQNMFLELPPQQS